MRAVSEVLVGIEVEDRTWSRCGGRSAGAAELAVHIAKVRPCERAGLGRLEKSVRENVLPSTRPHITARRRMLGTNSSSQDHHAPDDGASTGPAKTSCVTTGP